MQKDKVPPDVISYNATISAFEKGGQWQQALMLFEAMPRAKVISNEISYNATISACEKGGRWQQALMLFEAMQKAKVTPSEISYTATISACEKGGQRQQALMLFEAMSKAKVPLGQPSTDDHGSQWWAASGHQRCGQDDVNAQRQGDCLLLHRSSLEPGFVNGLLKRWNGGCSNDLLATQPDKWWSITGFCFLLLPFFFWTHTYTPDYLIEPYFHTAQPLW